MKCYSIGEFAKAISKTTKTLKPIRVEQNGYRYYSQEQLNHFLGLKQENNLNKKVVRYCRVSSHTQKDDLERQIENVRTYMYAEGCQFEAISDIGCGINIVTVFSCRLQGKRANKAKKIIKELL